MEYFVVRHQSRHLEMGFNNFHNAVNEKLGQGWILQGGVSITNTDMGYALAQAMVRVVPLPSNNRTTFLNNHINRVRG